MQKARGEGLKGDPQLGHVKVYQLVPMLTRRPGPQVGLYNAYSSIKWWRSEKLNPRIPLIVNEARHQSIICCLGVSEWLYEMVAVRNDAV